MQRYFTNKKEDNILILNEEDTYHITKVMRMKENDKVEIIYDKKTYIGEIIEIDKEIKCKIVEEKKEIIKEKPHIIIAQALVKEQKMDYILQKSCELGVDEIIPINTIRSIIKLGKNVNKKIERWSKILKEASEQSKRIDVPRISEVKDLKDLINVKASVKLICTVNEKSKTIKSVLSKIDNSDTIIFVIGPEGGFENKEEEFLINNGFVPISFGNNVLRTETASLFILSVVNYEFLR